MVTIKKMEKGNETSIGKDVEEIWTLVYCRREHKWCNHWKTVRWFLRNLKTKCPRASAIPLLSRYPKELKAGARRDICKPMFPAVLFTRAKRWKHPHCLWGVRG